MLLNQVNSTTYRNEFQKKFLNFSDKAPSVLSFVMRDDKVQVIHENSKTIYNYVWDYTIPVKTFIFNIKKDLLKHYPKLVKINKEDVPYTIEEKVSLIEEGCEAEDIPELKTVISEELFVIDKVIIIQDIFLLRNEKTNRMFRYKLPRSSVKFLKNYREGFFSSLEDASDCFFKSAILLNEVEVRSE